MYCENLVFRYLRKQRQSCSKVFEGVLPEVSEGSRGYDKRGTEVTISLNLPHAGIQGVAKTGTGAVGPAPGQLGENSHSPDRG